MPVEIERDRLDIILAAIGRPGSAVYDACESGSSVTLLLAGDTEPIVYDTGEVEVFDDFTAISGVGDATAKALRLAGFHTFEDLTFASDVVILDVVRPSVLGWIREYLKEHYL